MGNYWVVFSTTEKDLANIVDYKLSISQCNIVGGKKANSLWWCINRDVTSKELGANLLQFRNGRNRIRMAKSLLNWTLQGDS